MKMKKVSMRRADLRRMLAELVISVDMISRPDRIRFDKSSSEIKVRKESSDIIIDDLEAEERRSEDSVSHYSGCLLDKKNKLKDDTDSSSRLGGPVQMNTMADQMKDERSTQIIFQEATSSRRRKQKRFSGKLSPTEKKQKIRKSQRVFPNQPSTSKKKAAELISTVSRHQFSLLSHLANLSYQENDARLRGKEIKRSFSTTVPKFSSSCLGDLRENHKKAGYFWNIRNANASTPCLNVKIKELPVT